jgi:hypothetical protein
LLLEVCEVRQGITVVVIDAPLDLGPPVADADLAQELGMLSKLAPNRSRQ